MHTKLHFKAGDKVRLEVLHDLEMGDCSVSAALNGVTPEAVLTISNVSFYRDLQFLQFEPPYNKFGSMLATRFVLVEHS